MTKQKSLSCMGIVLALAGFITLSTAPAQAQYYRYGDNRFNDRFNVDRAQSRMLNRIESGYRSGRLTASEYNALMQRYNQTAFMESRMRDGGLNWRERERLRNRLTNLNDAINREMYDRNYSSGRNWWWF